MTKNRVEELLNKKPVEGNGYVYVLRNTADGKIYVGQTQQKPSSRVIQHNNTKPKNMTNKKLASYIKCGGAYYEVIKIIPVLEKDINEMELHYMTTEDAIQLGLNTNKAPKVKNGNKVSKFLARKHAVWNKDGAFKEYELSDVEAWAKKVVSNSELQVTEEEFKKGFITFVSNRHKDTLTYFLYSRTCAGDGSYKKICASTAAKYLRAGDDVMKFRMVTKRLFFFNSADIEIFTKKELLCKNIKETIKKECGDAPDAFERAISSSEVADALFDKINDACREKVALEAELRKRVLR